MAELSLAFLGPPVVQRDAAVVSFDTKKAVALLAVLAITGGDQSRDRLAALLWPESDTARARGSLRRTLSVTASVMGEGLAITRTTVALRPDRVRVDVTDFEALAARPDLASLESAVRLYRDDLLAGFWLRDCPEFGDWQASSADGLRQALAGALARMVAGYVGSGDPARALGHARRWVTLDPLHEPAHQAVIRLLAWSGQRSAAIHQYRELVRVLDSELAVRPLPETTRLYDDVRAGRVEPMPGPIPARLAALAGGAVADPAARADQRGTPWPIAGRAGELGVLSTAWAQVSGTRSGGQVVAVAGEAGSGKTTLIETFLASADVSGASIVQGRCHDGESGLPFALAADLLRSAMSASPGLAARLPAQVAAMASRLAPELADPGADQAPLSSALGLARLYAAIRTTLGLAAAGASGQAGILVVEDVHWADRPSLDLLGYLVRRFAGWPWLLVLSWRPEQAERLRGLQLALADAADSGRGRSVTPRPLRAEEIAELLRGAGLPQPDVPRMLAETRGLPMLVREYAEALRTVPAADAGAQPDVEDWSPPESVRGLLGRRLRAASEPAAQIVSTAAVLGSGCDADLLRAVSGRGEAETVDALDEALARFLLIEIPPAGGRGAPSYDFPYEALCRVAYELASLARRRLLHGRAADALAARYERNPQSARPAIIAGHLQRAGRDAEAARWWWQAAARARELYAHAEAHACLRQALALGYPPVPGCIAVGDVLTVLGRYREALAEYETAAAARDNDASTAAAIEHKLAEVHHRLGDWDLAGAHLDAAADLLLAGDLGGLARVDADRAVVAYRRGAHEKAARWSQTALSAAVASGDAAAVAQARNVLGMLAARDGDHGAAEEHLRGSLTQAQALNDPGAAAAALNNLARLLADTGRTGEALDCAQQALILGSELGDQHRVASLHTNLADLLHASGHEDEALGHLKEAARRFAALDAGRSPRPEIWMLVEW